MIQRKTKPTTNFNQTNKQTNKFLFFFFFFPNRKIKKLYLLDEGAIASSGDPRGPAWPVDSDLRVNEKLAGSGGKGCGTADKDQCSDSNSVPLGDRDFRVESGGCGSNDPTPSLDLLLNPSSRSLAYRIFLCLVSLLSRIRDCPEPPRNLPTLPLSFLVAREALWELNIWEFQTLEHKQSESVTIITTTTHYYYYFVVIKGNNTVLSFFYWLAVIFENSKNQNFFFLSVNCSLG